MSRRIAQVWIFGLLMLWAPSAWAQIPFSQNMVPTRTALGRLGLERHWMGVVPLTGPEQVLQISISGDLLFAQTNSARLHVYNAESGKLLWSAEMGNETNKAFPASANSYAVFVTSSASLFAFERNSGRLIWKAGLDTLPSSPTVCDEHRVMVGLSNGDIVAYEMKRKDDQGKEYIQLPPYKIWNWHSVGSMISRPLPAERIVIFGGADGKVYVAFSDERQMIYRIATGGPIGEGFGTYGTRTLIVPSRDQNVYAVDLFTSNMLWTFPTGAPVIQAPLVSGDEALIINSAGNLSSVDPKNGSVRWTSDTHAARLIALAKSKVYLRSENRDLYLIDRTTGSVLSDPTATHMRAGLNLRDLNLSFTNSLNDRMYFGSSSGLILCIREISQIQPLPLRDPKALPFGYIPPEGLKQEQHGHPAAEFRVGGEGTDPTTGTDEPKDPGAEKPNE